MPSSNGICSGVGQHVDISMLDVQVSLLNYMATMHCLSGENPHPIGNSHFVHVPYNSYPTADGHIVICVLTDNFWQNLKALVNCAELDKPEYDGQPGRLADKNFIDKTLADIFRLDTSANWLTKLNAARIPVAPVNNFAQALSDPQIQHRNMLVELKHPAGKSTKGPGNPIKLSRSSEESFSAAPLLGQNTDEIMAELANYSAADTASLKAAGIIA